MDLNDYKGGAPDRLIQTASAQHNKSSGPLGAAKLRERDDVGVPMLAVYSLAVHCESISEKLCNLDMRDPRDPWETLVQLRTLSPANRNETKSATGGFPNPEGPGRPLAIRARCENRSGVRDGERACG
jgi:hypothetical protein